jgi:hypothetical protein
LTAGDGRGASRARSTPTISFQTGFSSVETLDLTAAPPDSFLSARPEFLE